MELAEAGGVMAPLCTCIAIKFNQRENYTYNVTNYTTVIRVGPFTLSCVTMLSCMECSFPKIEIIDSKV